MVLGAGWVIDLEAGRSIEGCCNHPGETTIRPLIKAVTKRGRRKSDLSVYIRGMDL